MHKTKLIWSKFYIYSTNLCYRAHFVRLESVEAEYDFSDPSKLFVSARQLFERNIFDAVDMLGVAAGVLRMKNITGAAINLETEDLSFLELVKDILENRENSFPERNNNDDSSWIGEQKMLLMTKEMSIE